jgi:hypothetical protein
MSMTKIEARRFIREHFATYIEQADCAFTENIDMVINDVWSDECARLAQRLRRLSKKQEPKP